MTVGIYIRVSTDEQAKEGYSIPAQKERLTAYCAAQGWVDYKFYIDEGVSAKDTNRPKLQLLMDHVRGGQISLILVYRLDRFTRSVRDLYNLLETLEKHQCAFKSATEIYDTSTAMGRMFIGLVALLAQWETENLSERVKMALKNKVSGGERVGNIPYGFDLSDDETLVPNEQSNVVIDMISKVRKGMSAHQLSRYLNKTNNDRFWHVNGVLRVLRNPALYGATRWVNETYENTHKGIITKEDFLQLQQILEDRKIHHRRDVESTYLFQGILACQKCGNILSVNRHIRTKKDGSTNEIVMYKCQHCYKKDGNLFAISEQRFTEALSTFIKDYKFTENDLEIIEQKDERTIIIDQLKQIEKMRERYQRGWAAGHIKDDEFEKRMQETSNDANELNKQLKSYSVPVVVNSEAIKDFVMTFNEGFTHLTKEEKSEFISQFIRKIDFKLIPQPPKSKRNKKGKELVVVTDVQFY